MLRLHDLQARGLDPVSLTVNDGACVAIYGASGAGKTVLLRAIADLDENAGEAETENITRSVVPAPEWRRAVTYVPAESGWWADRVGDHLQESPLCHDLLTDVGLPSDCLTWEIARLSTGEKQRLALVRALLCDPEVLLLDEPTAALDPAATERVENVLTAAMARGLTLVIVSHEAAQAKRLDATVATIENGQVRLDADGEAP